MLIKYFQRTRIIFANLFAAILILNGNILAQECKSKVEIVTDKNDAVIIIDSVLIGKGKVRTELEKGNHFLWIKESSLKWGMQEIKDTLRIVNCWRDYFFNYGFRSAGLSGNPPINFAKLNSQTRENFFSSDAFKILLGSAAVLGGAAAYFKIQADKKYDEYLQTKNQSTLDDVNRLDLISGISFGLLQINFGYLIYKFLTE